MGRKKQLEGEDYWYTLMKGDLDIVFEGKADYDYLLKFAKMLESEGENALIVRSEDKCHEANITIDNQVELTLTVSPNGTDITVYETNE